MVRADRHTLAGLLGSLLTVGGCSLADVDLEGKRCPCTVGWYCDPATDTCTEARPRDGGLDGGRADGGPADAGRRDAPVADAPRIDGGSDGGGPDPTYADVVLADEPYAYWRFDEEPGSPVAADTSGNGRDGTYVGGVTLGEPGVAGRAIRLDGTSGRVVMGDIADFPDRAPFTLEIWVRPSVLDGVHRRLFDKNSRTPEGRQGYTTFVREAVVLDGGPQSTMALELWRDQSVAGAPTTNDAIATDRFVHIVATYDGITGVIYFDGAEVARSGTTSMLLDNTGPLVIGSDSDQGFYFYGGALDEAAIYDRALSATEVLEHYTAGAP